MRARLPIIWVLILIGHCPCFSQISETEGKGHLVIVGGGLRASNESVYRAFIDRSGNGRVGIIAAASSKPHQNAEKFRGNLIRYGVDRKRIQVLPIAVLDDPTTSQIDESSWSENANDPNVAEQIGNLSAIWFTGGDQSRIEKALRNDDGSSTAALDAIHSLYEDGGVIGGTSAGAAIQSERMILGGASPAALDFGLAESYPGREAQENGALVLGEGLGFFPHGLIDQHFERKARIGRLAVAVMLEQEFGKLGYGIDEDTALVYDSSEQTGWVVGSGTVTIVNAKAARINPNGLSGVRISVLGPGDRIRWPDNQVTVNPKKDRIENEYLAIEDARAAGLFSPYGGRLEDALGFLLVDNAKRRTLESFVPSVASSGRLIQFLQDEQTRGYWGYLDGQRERYTILDVELRISSFSLR